MLRRRTIFRALGVTVAVALVAVPMVLAAPGGPTAGQRIDMKVLLVSPNATDAVYGAWRETLGKLGVPYDAYVTGQSPPITDATLADYAANRARYQAVILASSAISLSLAERAALDKLETSFGVREISDNTNPDAAHGATPISGVTTPASPNLTGTLTDAGKAVFPYLKGPVPLGGPSFAASGTPGPNFTSLVNAPAGGSYMGVWKRPNGTEQLVDGIPGNGQQIHYQLLRYGMLNWVTRGVYLGYWRDYFEVQVDDLFLGDDAWNPATHATNYDPAVASRMTPTDLAKALSWSQANRFRFDFAFNAGGHAQFLETHLTDPLWDAFGGAAGAPYRSGFGFINHTYDHAFLGCSSANFITWEITQNIAAGQALGLPMDPKELISGEHSGLANTRPGNPGVLDPPDFEAIDGSIAAGGTLAVGTYFYAVTVSSAHGQTSSPGAVQATVDVGQNAVTASVSMVCKGLTYALYRGATATGPWALVAQFTQSGDTQTDNGSGVTPAENRITLIDTGATVAPVANTGPVPPVVNTAAMDPYPMNANYPTGVSNGGVSIVATDSSKTYPIETNPTVPSAVGAAQYPAGAAFTLPAPGGKVISTDPRYPTNVYYNTSRQGQQLDEYNWIYNAAKGCIPIPAVTTCNTADLTWDQYLAVERGIVLGHITGNDARPHYAHQSNFADYNPALPETDPNQGGILYPYLDSILGTYHGLYADNTPIVQLSSSDISATLVRQQTWAASVAAGAVSGYIQDDKVHIVSTAPMQVPITGTVGDDYAGTKSAWLLVTAGDTVLNLRTPIVVPAVLDANARGKQGPRPVLTKLKMSNRKFAAARRGLAKRRSQTQISWKLNRVATVHLVVQLRLANKNRKARWRWLGTITKKNAKAGTSRMTFTGKLGKRKIGSGYYRLVATATAGKQKSAAKTLRFSVVRR
jgi:hypothetical protein